MRFFTRRCAAALATLLLLSAGCASGGSRPAVGPRVEAPVLLTRTQPLWRFPTGAQVRPSVDIQIEVHVDATGRPEVETLRITGLGAEDNRNAVTDWLKIARFRPARQDGQPVPGVYKQRLRARGSVRTTG